MTNPTQQTVARDIRTHCEALIILKATGCTDDQAFKAADDIARYRSMLRTPEATPATADVEGLIARLRGEGAEIWGARDGRDTITHGSYAPPTHWLCECPPLPGSKA